MTERDTPFWQPARHADRRPVLLARGRMQAAIRTWFTAQGFVEVDTAALQVSPGNETHLHAFATEFHTEAGVRAPLYLQTSPEFAMKKLLAAGETKIFQFASAFRNREVGRLHAPAFTMLEWYRVDAPWTDLIEDCAAILGCAADAAGCAALTYGGRAAAVGAGVERLTVADAFRRHAGIDLLVTIDGLGTVDRGALAAAAAGAGIRVAADDSWSDIFSRVLVERIDPHLGTGRPTALTHYPVHEAALARATGQDPRLAERFELFACGVELANCFGELTDAAEQRRRFGAEMAEKARIYGERYPIDEDFLAALAAMPPASGAALGFDRLVMLAAGARTISETQWAPVALPRNCRAD